MNIHVVSRSEKRMLTVRRYSHKRKMSALYNAKASLAIEGLYLSNQEEQLLLKRVNREIRNTEFLAKAIEIAKHV
ncbi:hypothetical protein [Paenibacillus aquistagni]|uniref:hypothetical protein n=1 Tax=Paenibacillus aquistagni TaxID=1852522 RepID=UPI00145B2989|nr:hypothetical protein [Paenibacillus aquistagni]NMM54640.1 hypothetical protein [Paenibacillus aquistagni]